MPKQNAIEKAIASLQAEIDVLNLAIQRLKEQERQKTNRKLRAVKPKAEVKEA